MGVRGFDLKKTREFMNCENNGICTVRKKYLTYGQNKFLL